MFWRTAHFCKKPASARLNPANDLGRKPLFSIWFTEGAGASLELVSRIYSIPNGPQDWIASSEGWAAEFKAINNQFWWYDVGNPVSHLRPMTVAWVAHLDAFTHGFPVLCNLLNSDGDAFRIGYSNSGGYDDLYVGSLGAAFPRQRFVLPSTIAVTGETHHGVYAYAPGGYSRMWINGIELSPLTPSAYGALPNFNAIGGTNLAGLQWDGPFMVFHVVEEAWGAAQAREWARNPYQALQPMPAIPWPHAGAPPPPGDFGYYGDDSIVGRYYGDTQIIRTYYGDTLVGGDPP